MDNRRVAIKEFNYDTDEFDNGVYEKYIHLKTEWGSHEFVDSMPKLICKWLWRKVRGIK